MYHTPLRWLKRHKWEYALFTAAAYTPHLTDLCSSAQTQMLQYLELSQCYSANVSLSSFLIVVVVEGLLGVDTVWFTCKQSTDITSNSYQTHHSDYIVVWPFKHPSHCLIILHILHQFFLHSFVINHTLLLTPLTSSPCIPCFFIYPDSRSMNAAQTFFIVSCHVSYKTYTPW